MNSDRQMVPLDRQESISMVAGAPFGRVVFTDQALPAIRPVNHVVDADDVIIRGRLGSAVSSAPGVTGGVVVAYEADEMDPHSRLGWSVVITGLAHVVEDEAAVARYEGMLQSWVSHPTDQVIRIVPNIVTGFRLVASGLGALDGEPSRQRPA